jgi:hemerythrin superfamily protein
MKRAKQLHYLSWDHHSTLMEAFKIQKYANSFSHEELMENKNRLINIYKNELLEHFRAEEECLLPKMILSNEVNKELIRKTLDEHTLIHSQFLMLKNESNPDNLRIKLKEIAKTLNDHIRFEERELFEHSQMILSDKDLDEIEEEIFLRYGNKYKNSSCQLPEV